jgi:hypothetical protein
MGIVATVHQLMLTQAQSVLIELIVCQISFCEEKFAIKKLIRNSLKRIRYKT